MADDLSQLLAAQGPQADRPLAGLTVLLVEDSRYASEAIRLMCLRSGARIRRADCLRSAERHLKTYRPSVVIVDPGLPDGSGLDLIAAQAATTPRVPVLLGSSGDAAMRGATLAAGADGFLDKPITSLAAFQAAIMAILPDTRTMAGAEAADLPPPDPMALRDDLALAADILDQGPDQSSLDYVAQFLGGIARSAHDRALEEAAARLAGGGHAEARTLSHLVHDRLQATGGL
jgi:CheY-like chemotaxis protein